MKKSSILILIIALLVIIIFLFVRVNTFSKNDKNETTSQTKENTTNIITNQDEVKGIKVGDNLLKYGIYEGIDLATGSSITLNEDGTFLYENGDVKQEGVYEVKNKEIEDIEGKYNAWIIEFDSSEDLSNETILDDFFFLFTQTGDISQEEASINFNYKE